MACLVLYHPVEPSCVINNRKTEMTKLTLYKTVASFKESSKKGF